MTIAAIGGDAHQARQPPSSLLAPDHGAIADGVTAVLCGALQDWAGIEAASARGEMLDRLEALDRAEWSPLAQSFVRAALQAHVLTAHAVERLCEETGEVAPTDFAKRVEEFARARLAADGSAANAVAAPVVAVGPDDASLAELEARLVARAEADLAAALKKTVLPDRVSEFLRFGVPGLRGWADAFALHIAWELRTNRPVWDVLLREPMGWTAELGLTNAAAVDELFAGATRLARRFDALFKSGREALAAAAPATSEQRRVAARHAVLARAAGAVLHSDAPMAFALLAGELCERLAAGALAIDDALELLGEGPALARALEHALVQQPWRDQGVAALRERARAALAGGSPEAAEQCLAAAADLACRLGPNAREAGQETAVALAERALLAELRGRFDEAVALVEEALRAPGTPSRALYRTHLLQLARCLRTSAGVRAERAAAGTAVDICRSVLADLAAEDDPAETDLFRAELARSLRLLATPDDVPAHEAFVAALEEAIAAASPDMRASARAKLLIAAADTRLALAASRRDPARLRAYAAAAEEALAGLGEEAREGLAWDIEARRALTAFELQRPATADEVARSISTLSRLAEDARALTNPVKCAALFVALAHLCLRQVHLGAGSDAELEAAERALGQASEFRSRALDPFAWAQAQQLLGEIVMLRGQRPDGLARVAQAIAAFREALKERPRAGAPALWAETQLALGRALAQWGARSKDAAALRAAPLHVAQAMREMTREKRPGQWAQAQTALGYALRNIGEHLDDTAALRESIAAFDAAETVLTRDAHAQAWTANANVRGLTLLTLGQRTRDPAVLARAVGEFGSVAEMRPRASQALAWAEAQHNLARALTALAQANRATAPLREAFVAFEAALSERRKESAPALWSATRAALAKSCELFVDLAAGTAEAPAAQPAREP